MFMRLHYINNNKVIVLSREQQQTAKYVRNEHKRIKTKCFVYKSLL